MKILILSCSMGGGHNTAAKAVQEVLGKTEGVECEFKDALSFWHQAIDDLMCNAYIDTVKVNPKLFGRIYKIADNLWKTNPNSERIKSPVYQVNQIHASELGEYIEKNGFDAVISSHIFPAQTLTHLKRHGKLKIPTFYISTDYACIPFLEETEMDYIFSPHKDSIETFTVRGIPEQKVFHTGIPVSQKFVVSSDKKTARKTLGIEEDSKVILIMTGSMGFGSKIGETVKLMFENPLMDEKTRIIVITGNNEELLEKLTDEFSEEKRVIPVGFTDNVSLYMDGADILLSKPGGLSSTEAIAKGIPLIHTDPIPGCESINARFFGQHHLSLCAEGPEESSSLAMNLLNDDFMKNQIVEAQKHYRYDNSARIIADFVVEKVRGNAP